MKRSFCGKGVPKPCPERLPGLTIVRIDAPLFFANATFIRDEIRLLTCTGDPLPRAIRLDNEATDELDVPGADMLSELAVELAAHNIELLLARIHTPVHDMLRRTGVVEAIGQDHINLTARPG